MKLNYLCPLAQQTGVARAAHDYCMALIEAGADLAILPMFPCDTDNLEPHYKKLEEHAIQGWPEADDAHIWLVHCMPGDLASIISYVPQCKFKICVTTWETDRLPREYAELLDQYFDLVIVPSEHSKSSLESAGLMVEVVVLPHAIGPIWTSAERQWNHDDPYIFYSIGAWGERKNLLGLIKAYFTEFEPDEKVRLAIKTDQVDDDTIAALKLGCNLREFPMLAFDVGWLNEASLLQYHQDCNCYVTATRGEGFGLGAFEACALGQPVIAPEEGGQATFLDSYEGVYAPVGCMKTPAVWTQSISVKQVALRDKMLDIKEVRSIVPKGVDGTQYWFEPNLEVLQTQMRTMYEHRVGCSPDNKDYGTELALVAREKFRKRYSYATIGSAFRQILEQL
jgi:glycosyltransferase involved in cell wall biosynthesis